MTYHGAVHATEADALAHALMEGPIAEGVAACDAVCVPHHPPRTGCYRAVAKLKLSSEIIVPDAVGECR